MKRLSEKQRFMVDMRKNFYRTRNDPDRSFRNFHRETKQIFRKKPEYRPFNTMFLMMRDGIKEGGLGFVIAGVISFLLAWLLFCWAVMTSFVLFR